MVVKIKEKDEVKNKGGSKQHIYCGWYKMKKLKDKRENHEKFINFVLSFTKQIKVQGCPQGDDCTELTLSVYLYLELPAKL